MTKPTAPRPLTATDLPPLLEILRDPAHPAFAQALARVTTLDPTTLTATTAPALLAQLKTTLDALAHQKSLTAEQLATVRQRNTALQSYNRGR